MQFIQLTVATLEHTSFGPAAPKGIPGEILVAVIITVTWIWEFIEVPVVAIVVIWAVLFSSASVLPPKFAQSILAASITVWAADLVVPATICASHIELPGGRDLFLLHICRAVKITYGLILGYIEMRSEKRCCKRGIYIIYI